MDEPTGPQPVTPTLLDAYRATHYCVTGTAPPFLLRVDVSSEDLVACHRRHGVSASAFVTAWNPGSRLTAEEANAAAQRALVALLQQRGLPFLDGVGVDPAGQWAGEESLLVLGIGREDACDLGRRFGQNGILWSGEDGIPHLVLLA